MDETLPNFFFAFTCVLSLGFVSPVYSKEKTQNQVLVSAYVDEHIGFRRTGDKLSFATNLKSGFWVITEKGSLSGKEKDLYIGDLKRDMLIIVVAGI